MQKRCVASCFFNNMMGMLGNDEIVGEGNFDEDLEQYGGTCSCVFRMTVIFYMI